MVYCPHKGQVQYIPRNMHAVFALLCFVVVIHWLIFPYPSGLLHWHCGNLTIAPVPAKQPWWIWINTSCEFIMNDCITTTKQSTTKPCAYFLGYTVMGCLEYFCWVPAQAVKQTVDFPVIWDAMTLMWWHCEDYNYHYSDLMMNAMASQITGVWIACSIVFSGADQRKNDR